MTLTGCVAQGWRNLSAHKKSILYLYLVILGSASILLLPFMETFESSLGAGVYRERLVTALDYDWYQLFRDRTRGAAESFGPWVLGAGPFLHTLEVLLEDGFGKLPPAVLGAVAVYLLLHTFVLSAAVSSLHLHPGGGSTRGFLRNGADFFGRFLRLSVLALLLYWCLRQLLIPVDGWVDSYSGAAATEVTGFYLSLARYLLVLVLVLLLDLILDYARIKVVLEDRTSILLAVLAAARFCAMNFLGATGLYLLLVCFTLIWAGIYLGVDRLVDDHYWGGILVAFVVQQIYMLGRMALKLLGFGAQIQFVKSRDPWFRDRDPLAGRPEVGTVLSPTEQAASPSPTTPSAVPGESA
ncbi:MAG: hypothetical protein OXH11_06480 [Candidatus Aminicenantes bacterium]|nr:hypothetical protein [Candidatus Aminicenantes bacterium]